MMLVVDVDAEEAAQDDRPGVEGEADVDEDGRDDGQDGQPVAAGPGVALLQEVRQRGHPRPDVERREEEGQDDEQEGGHPLEVAVGQPVDVALLGQADEVDGRDVGREQGQADDRPAERAPGQEILGARGLLRPAPLPGPEPEADDADEVDGDDGQVRAGHRETGGAVHPAASVGVEDFFHPAPELLLAAGRDGRLAGVGLLPPPLRLRVGGHPGHVGGEIVAGVLEIGEQRYWPFSISRR